MQEPEANCSESRRLQRLLGRLWQELRGGGGDPSLSASSSPAARPSGENDAYLYILLIMIFYGCLAGGLILAYTRSRKLESKHDPYHLYIERDWAAGGGGPVGKGVPASPAERSSSSGESEPLNCDGPKQRSSVREPVGEEGEQVGLTLAHSHAPSKSWVPRKEEETPTDLDCFQPTLVASSGSAKQEKTQGWKSVTDAVSGSSSLLEAAGAGFCPGKRLHPETGLDVTLQESQSVTFPKGAIIFFHVRNHKSTGSVFVT